MGVVVGEPACIELGITERCNSRCVICSHDPRWKGDMPLSLVEEIIDAFPSTPEVQPHLFGEPFLHPQVLDIFDAIKSRGKRLIEYTNGSVLAGDILDGVCSMLTPGDIMSFSVEGYDRESYESMRPGLKWDRLLANIAEFQAKKPAGVKSELRMTEVREIDTAKAKAFWTGKVDLVWSVPEEPFGRSVKGHYKVRYDSRTCKQTHKDLTVRHNGDVVMCCVDSIGEHPIGNATTEPIRDIWFGAAFQAVRTRAHESCSHCLAQWVNEE